MRRVTPSQTEPVTMYNSMLKGAAGATGLAFAVTGSVLEAVPSTAYTWGGGTVSVAAFGLDTSASDYRVQWNDPATNSSVESLPAAPVACTARTQRCLVVAIPKWVHSIQATTSTEVRVLKGESQLAGSAPFLYTAYAVAYNRVDLGVSVTGLSNGWNPTVSETVSGVLAAAAGVSSSEVALNATAVNRRALSSTGTHKLQHQQQQEQQRQLSSSYYVAATIVTGDAVVAATAATALQAGASLTSQFSAAGLSVSNAAVSNGALNVHVPATLYCGSFGFSKVKSSSGQYSCVACGAGTYCNDLAGCEGVCKECPNGGDCGGTGTGVPT
eukprot:7136-Heterococcus_DN1.PRE.1